MPSAAIQFSAWEKYFELKYDDNLIEKDSGDSKSKSFHVTCLLCKPKTKVLSVSTKSSWNLKGHIESAHAEIKSQVFESVEKFKINLNERKRKINNEMSQPVYKQLKLTENYGQSKTTQNVVDKLIVDAVIDAVLPLSVVENKSVRNLLETAFPGRNVMHRKGLVRRIENNFTLMQDEMKTEFKTVGSVCLTADSWTSYRR